ncbi:MAG: hypothetical protein OXN17_00560 [Candidatus Poribacteria bacterium]|nr:hypothetical protein [Candidatus Poribacteria bacterium]
MRENPKSITHQSNLTARACKLLFIAVVMLPLNNLWVVDTGITGHGTNFTRVSLFMNVVFVTFVLSLINLLLKRFKAKLALATGDMVLIYSMLCVSSAIAGHDIIQRMFPLIGYAFHFATPENDWQALFHRYVPDWLVVAEKSVLVGYYKDREPIYANTLYIPEYLQTWIGPCLAWSTVIFAVLACMLCINVIVRKQWSERERLAYPLAHIPLQIIDSGSKIFSNRLLWVGFSVAVIFNLINGLHFLFPSVPGIFYGGFDLGRYFTTKPWNALGELPIRFHPFAIGLAFFMPLDLAFSCWFFYWFWRIEQVAGVALYSSGMLGGLAGYGDSIAGFPYVWAQSIGTCGAILLMTLWVLRFTGKDVLFGIFQRPRITGPSGLTGNGSENAASQIAENRAEMRQYRRAIIGIIASLSYLVGFCYIAGMSVWVATAFFVILFAISTVVTRIRAEAGYPMHDFVFRPDEIMVAGLGTRAIGARNLTLFSYLHFLVYAQRSNPQPQQLEAFRLSDRMNLGMDKMLIAGLLIAAVAGSIAACWAYLHTAYRYPVLTFHPSDPVYTRLKNWLIYPKEIDVNSLVFMGVGFGVGMWFMIMRRLFLWWPFHPAGYVIGGTWSLNLLWFSIFVSWAVKLIVLRFGGRRLHQQVGIFFIGLVLGEFVAASSWGIVGTIMGERTYGFI